MNEIGEDVADLIECLYEEQEKRYGQKISCKWRNCCFIR